MSYIELFAKRFNELSADLGKTHRELADELQINLHDIIRWSSGKNNYLPSVGKLLIFANYFHCSIDYMIGLTDTDFPVSADVKFPHIAGRFKKIVYENGYTFATLAKATGIKNTTLFYNWENGKSLPQIENLIKVAKALDCTLDSLVGRES